MPIWTVAIDVLEDARGTLTFYGFIIEEAIQSAGFACWILRSANKDKEAAEKAQWCINELILPAIDFFNRWGHITFPMNQAYLAFYEASKKTMETYIQVAESK